MKSETTNDSFGFSRGDNYSKGERSGDNQGGNIIPNSVLFNRKGSFRKGSNCPLSGKDAPVINYKNIPLLTQYISEKGRILPSRIVGVSAKKQRQLKKAINIARNLALLPFAVL